MTRGYDRRSILAGLAGAGLMTFDEWFAGSAAAAPSADLTRMRTRYEASSPQGQSMLRIYHDAVRKMMRTRARMPCSWTFQWYTHFVKSSTTKAAEIAAIYGSSSSPDKSLAEAMWDTCQAHGGQAPQDESWFLPWHRMYVFYFESIVRKVSGKPEFTLPYWNYSDPATGALPAPFRQTGSPLFRTTRNPGVNTGATIPPSQVVLTAMSETSYDPVGAASGFNQAVDFGIHGNIHVWVGNEEGMGQIPWAAQDPVFWMHHCNIDRLWASWNKGGRTNPGGAWRDQEFTFADADCKKVLMKNGDVDDTAKLHYEYDHYEPVPRLVALAPAAAPNPVVRLESVAPAGIAAGNAGAIALGAGPTRVPLTAPPAAAVAGQPSFAARMSALPAEAKVYLVMRNARADAQPGVVYDVYLDAPAGTNPGPDDAHHVGTINFFAAAAMGSMAGMSGGMQRTFSLDITQQAKALAASGQLSATPAVTIVPAGHPNEAAKPVLGQIQLVEQ